MGGTGVSALMEFICPILIYFCVFPLQDKTNMPWWLGLSPKGIGLYDHGDKIKPRKVILNNGNIIECNLYMTDS